MNVARAMVATVLAFALLLPGAAHAIRISGDLILKGERSPVAAEVAEIRFGDDARPLNRGPGVMTLTARADASAGAFERAVQSRTKFAEATLRLRDEGVEYRLRNVRMTGYQRTVRNEIAVESISLTYEGIDW